MYCYVNVLRADVSFKKFCNVTGLIPCLSEALIIRKLTDMDAAK